MSNYISYKNRGMLLENILNTTINYYNKNQIAYFAKNNLNIKFKSVESKDKDNILKLNSSFIKSKSTVDYYGVYKGKYVTFEAKSTDESSFSLSNIKQHQHEHLKLIKKLGGKSFYIIFFKKYSKLFLVDVEDIEFGTINTISLQEMEKISKQLEIIFPGIVDFLEFI